jgi:hypothetical protein
LSRESKIRAVRSQLVSGKNIYWREFRNAREKKYPSSQADRIFQTSNFTFFHHHSKNMTIDEMNGFDAPRQQSDSHGNDEGEDSMEHVSVEQVM